MRRRDLFAGYSLIVLADQLPAAPQMPGGVTERLRREMDQVVPPRGATGQVSAEPHMGSLAMETDVFVAGGGLAGVCAALAAARNGSRVVLVQDRSRLGGNSSSEVKMHVVGANSHKARPGWREGGILEELRLADAANNPQRCWEMWDLLLYDKVVSEPKITLLLETVLYRAEMKNGQIERVWARCDKSEILYAVKAKIYVDATGDSRLGLESGAEFRTGRERRSEFNESLAPEQEDQETLGSSILFTSRLYPKPVPYSAPAWARKVTKEHLRFRRAGPENWEYGYWWIEWGGDKDTIRDNERIRFELLSIVTGVWDYIKNSGEFSESQYYGLDWIGMMPGKRGSRRLLGDVLVTQHDLMRGTFPDAVAMGGWPMDDHPPGGFDRSDLPPNTVIRTPEVYDLPLRALYSRNVPNLMMAGRNISATHAAFTSTRVMATCACVGQAVGTAAAACVELGLTPRQLARDPKLVSGLQQRLVRQDQSIRTVKNEDRADLARLAAVRASSHLGEAVAERVLDGVDRDIPANKATKAPAEVHHWAAPLGSSLELTWPRPVKIGEVVLKFDSGFERELTLSSSNSISRGIVRAAQPELVSDYELTDGSGRTLASVTGNLQRLNRIRFEPVETGSLKLTLKKTHGIGEVRLFEIRCYPS